MTGILKDEPHNLLAVIPARWGSSRFPGKPLVLIQGIPMVVRVYQRVASHIRNVVIATDDERIALEANRFGAEVVLTSPHHPNGTSRCAEAAKNYSALRQVRFDWVINVQGDEPLIDPIDLDTLAGLISRPGVEIATLVKAETSQAIIKNPNRVKVVLDRQGYALYFSRLPVPFIRQPLPGGFTPVFHTHVGVYAFKTDTLERIATLPTGPAAITESLEQLAWMEHGYRILCGLTGSESFGVDTPEDLEELLKSGLIL
ncbi:MAG: 3-deoxy-manno-octulosonate cytidylyltransferase [Bacteroidales bacterium]